MSDLPHISLTARSDAPTFDIPGRALALLENHPHQVGQYRILEVVGEGGMGVVYRAEQRQPIHRIVALKLIKLGMDTREIIARFEQERQALAVMDHPSVARVYDAGATETGRPYFVMEYVAGEPITAYCDLHKLTLRRRLALFIDVCDAVQHAHTKGIIHRDIKPSNVLVALLDGKPTPKVIDFGVAKATAQTLTDRTLHTEHGRPIGTPEYMSPEQAEMSGLDVDARTDIYSLGVLLYELVTGVLPFDPRRRQRNAEDPPTPGTRLKSLTEAQRSGIAASRQTRAQQLALALRDELEWIPLKAMRRDRTERYRTASELADDVRNYLADQPLLAGPLTATYRVKKFLRRNKRGVAASAAMIVLLIAGIIATSVALIRETRARAEAALERDNAKALAQFLTEDLLASANPEIDLGRDMTVKEVVAQAVVNIGTRFHDRPLLEASIRNTLASVQEALGNYDAALPEARRALELRRAALGDAHPDTARAMLILAHAVKVIGDKSEAERLFRAGHAVLRVKLGENDRETLAAANDVGFILESLKRYDEAIAQHRDVLQRRRGAFAPDDKDVLESLNNLAVALQDAGQVADAEPLLREATELCRRSRGEDHPLTLASASNLAMALKALKRTDEAETLLRDVLARRTRVFKADHPATLATMNDLATVLYSLKQYEEAETLLAQCVQGRRQRFGDDHRYTLAATENLARVLDARGKLGESEPRWRALLEARQRLRGSADPATIAAAKGLARNLDRQDRRGEADAVRATTRPTS